MIGITMAAVFVSPYMIIVAAILFGVVYVISGYYLAGAREIKRLESTSKSPIFEQCKSMSLLYVDYHLTTSSWQRPCWCRHCACFR